MKKFSFYVMYKDFNTRKMKSYNVMPSLYGSILTSKNKVSKKWKEIHGVKTRKDLRNFIDGHFRYYYWAKCEWEFIARDWPTTDEKYDVKVDVYDQLEPNIDLITDLVWEQIKDKLND